MINFAILAIGGMTSMVRICLLSIVQVDDVKIYVMTEKKHFQDFVVFGEVTKNAIELIEEKELALDMSDASRSADASYENYGTNRFAQINTLKWCLIRNVLNKINQGEILVFSDFDVVWFKNPKKFFLQNPNKKILAQAEWSKIDDVKYCTGIIGFVKTDDIKKLFNRLTIFHQAQLALHQGIYFDQQAFNDFFLQPDLTENVECLSNESFVIGADIPKYLLRSYESIYAMHANYLKGARRKEIVMKAVMLCFERPIFRMPVALFVKILLLEGRIRVISNKITKKVQKATRIS
jgi:hypothetical protein